MDGLKVTLMAHLRENESALLKDNSNSTSIRAWRLCAALIA